MASRATDDRNESLDFLRGLAILLVIWLHGSENFTPLASASGFVARNFGSLGVQLFFIVSGYTMMLTFGGQVDGRALSAFYLRRFFRIAPPYWLAIAVYLVMYGLGPRYWAPHGIGWREVALNALFLNWTDPNAMNSVVPGGWSIATEIAFYAIFPLFAYLFFVRRARTLPYVLTIAIAMLGLAVKTLLLRRHFETALPPDSQHLIGEFFFFWLPNQIIAFGFGLALHQIFHERRIPVAGLVCLAAGAAFSRFDLNVALLFLVACLVMKAGIGNRAVASLGRASYALYLTHFAIIAAIKQVGVEMGRAIPMELAFIAVVVLTTIIAKAFVAPFVEAPAIALGKRLASGFRHDRVSGRAAAAAV